MSLNHWFSMMLHLLPRAACDALQGVHVQSVARGVRSLSTQFEREEVRKRALEER
jgi:hypothetical protein